MRRVIMALAALLVIGGGAGAQEKMTEAEKRELEQKLRQLQQEMRELERQLGRERAMGLFVTPRGEAPLAIAFAGDRPRLGVIVQTERSAGTDSLGAVLEAVTPDGPAAKAGLQSGDIVVTFDGTRLGTTAKGRSPGNHLIELAREMEKGDSIRVTYRRGSETRTAVIVPEMLNDLSYAYSFSVADSAMRRARDAMERAMVVAPRVRLETMERSPESLVWALRISEEWSDMELTTLDPELGSYFGTSEGLLVVRAPKDSLLGLKSGDVIRRIGGRVPSSPSQVVRILRSYEPGDEIRIEIMRNKSAQTITATVPERERGLFWEEK